MAYYLKYRPQKVSDLDSEDIRLQFSEMFSKKNFPHAFLFTGSKGIGKTSTARIVAKIINCEKRSFSKSKGEFIEPCNKCEMCTSITKGNSLDVMEIDAASNRGIDEMRSLREKISLAPSHASYKVYIIDEVHMLTTEAFNALLKTLEEPPQHVIFILCTTEIHKIPDTISSRCTVVVFKKASETELLNSLQRVVQGEKIKIENDALKLIAQFSDGSFRDGVKTLEHLVLRNNTSLTAEVVKKTIMSGDINEKDLINLILNKKAKEALSIIQKSAESGIDPRQLNHQLLNELRTKLIMEVQTKNGSNVTDIAKLIKLLTRAEGEIKYSPIGQLPIELAIVEYCFERGEVKR
ncbi:DNA polymerase III subunit gamma/tau [Candidatus Gottesmanbacteria bacterium]|nr:DNA polymerase III subunit gamma/tau [Candidatus Gottesmanbacteria bacterium]